MKGITYKTATPHSPSRHGRYQTKGTGWTFTPTRQRAFSRAVAAKLANAAGRRDDYGWLRSEQGLTVTQAASRMGVSVRTAERYEAHLKEAAA